MVLVAVGQENAPELVLVLHDVAHVRHHQVDAVHVVLGEAEAAVHDDHVLAVFKDGHVLADLAKSAEGYDLQFFSQLK